MSREKIENDKKFSVSIEKEMKKVIKILNVSFRIKFIDSAKFMTNWLSKLANNLVEEIHKITCKDCNCFF